MPQTRLNPNNQTPSHKAIDAGNPAIFKPTWLALDDINIDLLSIITTITALLASYFSRYPAKLLLPSAVAFIVALRSQLPRPKPPSGLVLITGASSGIGAELAYIFAEKGHELILVARDAKELQNVVAKIAAAPNRGKVVHTVITDLSLSGAAQRLHDEVKGKGFAVDVLVNNAGLGAAGDVFYQSTELVERMTMLNCVTVVQLTQLFGRDMVERGGTGWMLHVSSVGGWVVGPGHNIYHCTKHFVRAFSETLSIELRAYPGIVNTQLMPGPTDTQWIPRSRADQTLLAATSMAVADAKTVALAGYEGLVNRKRAVFPSYGVAIMGTVSNLLPRSVHLTLASVMNAPKGIVPGVSMEKAEIDGGSGFDRAKADL